MPASAAPAAHTFATNSSAAHTCFAELSSLVSVVPAAIQATVVGPSTAAVSRCSAFTFAVGTARLTEQVHLLD